MLTVEEIKNKTFKASGLGYDKRDVDAYAADVNAVINELLNEKREMITQINTLNDAVTHYKTIEKTMQKALILAEKTAEETKASAVENARQIENEAVTKAQIILSDARNELERINQQIVNMVQTFETYKINFKNLAIAQVELVNSDAFKLASPLGIEALKFNEEKREPHKGCKPSKEKAPDSEKKKDFEFIEGEEN